MGFVLFEFCRKGLAVDPQDFSCFAFVPVLGLKDGFNVFLLDLIERLVSSSCRVEKRRPGADAMVDQALQFDFISFGEDDSSFYGIFQLPDISRPVVLHQSIFDVGGNAVDVLPGSLVIFS